MLMDKKIKELVKKSIVGLINNTVNSEKINKIKDKHTKKIHFIPIRYRIFTGLLQSLNIQFGNYIEELLHLIIKEEDKLEIIPGLSGKRNFKLKITKETDNLIDNYITKMQTQDTENLLESFNKLLKEIIKNENDESKDKITTIHDIDALFKNKKTNKIYYLEIKYNDDHDTGKFVDINRKFIKTYAGIVSELKIKNIDELCPILFYFTLKKKKGNIYVPENTNIYRGKKLFDKFFTIQYDKLDKYLLSIGEDKEIIKIFDDLYKKIRNDLKIKEISINEND